MPVLHKTKFAIVIQSLHCKRETTLGQKTVKNCLIQYNLDSYVQKREGFLNKIIPITKCRTPYNLRQASFR